MSNMSNYVYIYIYICIYIIIYIYSKKTKNRNSGGKNLWNSKLLSSVQTLRSKFSPPDPNLHQLHGFQLLVPGLQTFFFGADIFLEPYMAIPNLHRSDRVVINWGVEFGLSLVCINVASHTYPRSLGEGWSKNGSMCREPTAMNECFIM